ncbi:MAG: hypothetical protein L6R41_000194 [Letrouitia leprolyta]|nr:MAG: hypothetical protein L6R41_000194 [Letrouitia leprolyta]
MSSNTIVSHPFGTGTLSHEKSHLGYQWGNFETEEDLVLDELYQCTSRAEKTDKFSSPFRDPESPLDELDLEHFNVKTADLASCSDSCSCRDIDEDPKFLPETPTIKPIESLIDYDEDLESHSRLPPPIMTLVEQQELLAAMERLERKVALLEASNEQNHNALEQSLLEKFDKMFSDGINKIIEVIDSGLHKSNDEDPTETEDSIAGAIDNSKPPTFPLTTGMAPHDQYSPPQSPMTILSPREEYIQFWHSGSLILIEHLSEQAPVRDIHALFQPFGRITYLELHGADKSRPHVPTRHAYIHYAERNQALEARRHLHGFRFQNLTLMVFTISTAIVRGEPGKPYEGSALEVLNFNGGSNYASPDADCFQVANAGLEQLNGESLPFQTRSEEPARFINVSFQKEDAKAEATYSLKPTLTEKTATASWRRMDHDVSADAHANIEDHDGKSVDVDGGEAMVFQGRGERNLPTTPHITTEGEDDDYEEGGVPLDLEAGTYSSYYNSEDEDEGLEFCTPVQPTEFL